MATIALLTDDERSRRDLTLAIEELGHRVAWAEGPARAAELLAEARPAALVVACDPASRAAEHALGEIDRSQPLLPVIVALGRRNASRATDLLRAGAYEVVAPPWSAENLEPTLAKALRFKGTAFEAPAPAEERRSRSVRLAAAAALLLAAGLVSARRSRVPPVPPPATQSWELPYAHPSGLAFAGGDLWVSDWFAQTVYRLDPRTRLVRRAVAFPKETPAALALTGDALWTFSAPGVMLRHMLDERLTTLGRIPDAAGPTVGMAYDGLYLWTVDRKARRIHRRILDDRLTEVDSFEYPGVEPAALAWDGAALWSVDAGNKELLRHSIQHPGLVTARATLPEYQDGHWKPVGLAFDGERFWTVAESRGRPGAPGRLFRHALAGLAP